MMSPTIATPDYYFPTKVNTKGQTVPDFDNWDENKNVKQSYINSSGLFDYVYSCRLGNGAKSTNDGSTFKGVGFVQITGKSKYEELSVLWNEQFTDEPKDFAGDDYELMETDIRVAMVASMFEWRRSEDNPSNELFKNALDGTWNDGNIKIISRSINGSGLLNESNGEEDRIKKSKKAYNKL